MARLLAVVLAASGAIAQSTTEPVRAVPDPGVVTTRQATTPAGAQAVFNGRVQGVVFGTPSSELWVLSDSRVFHFDWSSNRVIEQVALPGAPGLQGIQYDLANDRALVTSTPGPRDPKSGITKVALIAVKNGAQDLIVERIGDSIAGALALAPEPDAEGRRIAAIPLVHDDVLAVVDIAANRLLAKIKTEIAPFGAVVDSHGTVAWVSNWGGRVHSAGELTARSGHDRVVINEQGIASTGTVTRIDLASGRETASVAVGLHPTALAFDEAHQRLYVANGNSDSVSVVDTAENRIVRTISLQPFQTDVAGIAPTALALSPDGAHLFVACGGINAIAVVDTVEALIEGLVPTAWYPSDLSLSADGKYLAVSCLLGSGSGSRGGPRRRFVHAVRGSVAVLPIPDAAQLANYTTAVAANNRLSLRNSGPAPAPPSASVPLPVPLRAGGPSPIEHVVYIIKENRTYDQVFGDIAKGNGDPSLVMFGEDVTPNQHRLANQFVLLDNFYASGGNSADGHQWATQANETDYALWPGYTGRSYPFDGNDPIAYSSSGFIWDAALRMGKTVRVYGEFAPSIITVAASRRPSMLNAWKSGSVEFSHDWNVTSPIPGLDRVLAHQYPSFCLAIPDVIRAQIFLADVDRWEQEGAMPNLTILALPSNHTWGATPGVSSAKAMVADNDLALGQIVERLTKTPFWNRMAIFVVEDDAQGGVDHVDGHRTVALAISPYARRGSVDSSFYSQQSILKTIELILGLPALSLFDLIASDMRASFQNTPDNSEYTAVLPKQPLAEMNPPLAALRGTAKKDALACMKMRWNVPDAVPSGKVNRILWRQTMGPGRPYPETTQSVFAPLSIDLDDDERE